MSEISIKQNKKGTFLDFSSQSNDKGILQDSFLKFSSKSAAFLSGQSISLILPDFEDEQSKDEVLSFIRSELNKLNISVKQNYFSSQEEIENMAEARTSNSQEEEIEEIDTSALPETLYVESNLRSGQMIRYPANVFVLGDVNPSAEIIAGGDVIVMGNLRGYVHAGYGGNKSAKIISTNFMPAQIRIAEEILAINDIDKNKTKKKEGYVLPLVAKIENGEIIISRYFG